MTSRSPSSSLVTNWWGSPSSKRTSTSGKSRPNRARARGISTSLAVGKDPRPSRPRVPAAISRTASCSVANAPSVSIARSLSNCASAVGRTPWASRSNSTQPAVGLESAHLLRDGRAGVAQVPAGGRERSGAQHDRQGPQVQGIQHGGPPRGRDFRPPAERPTPPARPPSRCSGPSSRGQAITTSVKPSAAARPRWSRSCSSERGEPIPKAMSSTRRKPAGAPSGPAASSSRRAASATPSHHSSPP